MSQFHEFFESNFWRVFEIRFNMAVALMIFFSSKSASHFNDVVVQTFI